MINVTYQETRNFYIIFDENFKFESVDTIATDISKIMRVAIETMSEYGFEHADIIDSNYGNIVCTLVDD